MITILEAQRSGQFGKGRLLPNIVAPLFGGFAATGAFACTANNVRNGGTSPLAGVTHTLTLVPDDLVA